MTWKLFVPALLIGAFAAAPPATAAPAADNDSVYFDFLQSHGVSIDQPEPLKTTASQICQGFDDGLTFTQVGGALMQRGEARMRRRSRSSVPWRRTARRTTRSSTLPRRRDSFS